MATLARGLGLLGLICLPFTAGCGNSPDSTFFATGSTGGAGNSPTSSGGSTSGNFGGTNGLGGGGIIPIPAGSELERLLASCGNGQADNEKESCDDGNKEGKDGCTRLCQVETGWTCPKSGPCVNNAVCGDGVLSSGEACDDHNTKDGDGCAADCRSLTDGWECRAPGTDCFPICGDGRIMKDASGQPAEGCDDNNTANLDGCSSTCNVEPGATCKDEPSKCTQAKCGNGAQGAQPEAGESCDFGTEKNGLFFGDGTGCSKTCTKEPTCRDSSGKTVACSIVCGDGNVDTGEGCDDGNGRSGDGCSATCSVEDGFNCTPKTEKDTAPCTTSTGECLILPIIYRDFDGQNQPNGHPDFFYLGATPTGGTKTICVPNASGRTQGTSGSCPGNDSTPLCLKLVKDTLDATGKPVANTARTGGLTCACQFTDWDKTPVTSGVSSGAGVTVTTCGSGSTQGVPSISITNMPVFQSADSFKEWYNDGTRSTKVVSTLELAQQGTTNQYQFSSSVGNRGVYDDIHDIFLRQGQTVTGQPVPANAVSSLVSGFFPLDTVSATASRPKVCNLWPYWTAPATCIAQQWDARGWSGNQATIPSPPPGFMLPNVAGMPRNFYFTSEVRYLFRYAGGEVLSFFGDDDVWVFINGHLVLDLGAPHERLRGTVTLSAAGTTSSASATVEAQDVITGAFIAVGSVQNTSNLGLEAGRTYEIAVFHADVHPRESNYQLTLFGFSTTKSVCTTECGNGIKTMGEQCDNGPNNSDDAYNGCTKACKYGPYCGDGTENGGEFCDHGRDNGDIYGKDGCTSDCKQPPYCGDGSIDSASGEECDQGEATSSCTDQCTFTPSIPI